MKLAVIVIIYSGTNKHQVGKWFSLLIRSLTTGKMWQRVGTFWTSRKQPVPSASPSQPDSSGTPLCISVLWKSPHGVGARGNPRKTSDRATCHPSSEHLSESLSVDRRSLLHVSRGGVQKQQPHSKAIFWFQPLQLLSPPYLTPASCELFLNSGVRWLYLAISLTSLAENLKVILVFLIFDPSWFTRKSNQLFPHSAPRIDQGSWPPALHIPSLHVTLISCLVDGNILTDVSSFIIVPL